MYLLHYGLKAWKALKSLRCDHFTVPDIVSEIFLTNNEEGYVGLDNLGNTCYFNSVVQALFFCAPFRRKLLQYHGNGGSDDENNTILTCLADLFHRMNSKKKSHVSPRRFVKLVIKTNETFRCSKTHHDAHEFLIFLLNSLDEQITARNNIHSAPSQLEEAVWNNTQSAPSQLEEAGEGSEPDSAHPTRMEQSQSRQGEENTISDIFGGTFTNETRCSCCETVTCREEPFMDLSVEIQQNYSLSGCLDAFSAVEILSGTNKYWCDKCCHFQDAEKKLKIKSPPQVLICQLKRFKYTAGLEGFKKLFYRVAFPMEFRLPINSCVDKEAEDYLYSLFAVVVHIGHTMNYGHYFTLVKSGDQWLKFNDDNVEKIEETELQNFFGSSDATVFDPRKNKNAYILFYQVVNGRI